MGITYFFQSVVRGMLAQLAWYFEVPVLSFPTPATSRVAALLALAQNDSALYSDGSRACWLVIAPPA